MDRVSLIGPNVSGKKFPADAKKGNTPKLTISHAKRKRMVNRCLRFILSRIESSLLESSGQDRPREAGPSLSLIGMPL